VNENRIQQLNGDDYDPDGSYVLYWMQQPQRAHANPALEFAVRQANRLGQGVVVCFGLMADYPEANRRHFAFMLEGLAETAGSLHDRGIKFVPKMGDPDQIALAVAKRASVVICDCGYLRHQRQWRRQVAALLRKHRLAVRASGSALEGAAGVRQGSLHERRRFKTQV
jgi:deoxyribodipyrimidine photo-lyase